MKKSLIVATFLAVGGGAVSVSAGNPASLKGSDTLFDFTNAVIAACPGTQVGAPPLAYGGTGSGAGEKQMLAGTQQIAPMSRFINKNVCTGTAASPTTSQGLVVGLDGISIVGSKSTFANTACNGDANTLCDTNFEPATGAAYNTAITAVGAATCTDNTQCRANETCICPGGAATPCSPALSGTCEYVAIDWRDILRVLLAGMDHKNGGTAAANYAVRDCNSPIRQALANSYGKFFENNCSAPAGDGSGGLCSQIRHIFRRDDFSGTTDAVVALLNLPGTVTPETTVTVFPAGVSTSIVQHTGMDAFCNSVRPAFALPQSAAGTCTTNTCTTTCADGSTCTAGVCTTTACTVGGVACGDASACAPSAAEPTCLSAGDNTWDPTSANKGAGCAFENAVYRSTMQDNDPIRRTCQGAGSPSAIGGIAEDNCSHSGDLGLILSMNDVPETGDVGTTSDPLRYNAAPCIHGHNTSVTFPDVFDAVTQGKQICARGLLCPNGDKCTNLGACIAPSDVNGNAQCLAGKLTAPALTISAVPVPLINPRGPGIAEGRAYNQHLYKQVGSAGAYQSNGFNPALPVTGAFYRIHTNHSLNPSSTATAPILCQFPDMTDQIGCLVNASPCSIGYAGRGAADHNPNVTDAVKINKQNPITLCIVGDGTVPAFVYPLSRKLYLDTVPGFAAVTGNEQSLVGCETDLAQTAAGTVPLLNANSNAGIVTTAIVNAGFLAVPSYFNSGEPFCEDFNENMLCSPSATKAPNVPSCPTAVPSAYSAFPLVSTTCGDGKWEAFEDCDCGTLQAAANDTGKAGNVANCGATINGGTYCTTTCRTVH